MPLLQKIRDPLKKDWIIGLGLLCVFLLTNGYTYAWDDQHLEIPLLKALINPELYPNDYYIESLKKNFTSFLYPILAKIIPIDAIPAAYLILYLLSRFALFFFAFKLWKVVSQSRLHAALCVLSMFLIFRVEEFLYRTFSHQEFALAIIMAGLYYFYKNRFVTSAVLLGIAANFHALYAFFPFCYMALYLCAERGRENIKNLFLAGAAFVVCSLPFTIWTVLRFSTRVAADPSLFEDWIALYLIACPQNFLFGEISLTEMFHGLSSFLKATLPFLSVLALWGLNVLHNKEFLADKKGNAIMLGGLIFLVISFIFSYLAPNRFVLDLNLIRNLQFMLFVLVGHTMLLIARRLEKSRWSPGSPLALTAAKDRRFEIAVIALLIFPLLRFGGTVALLAIVAITLLFLIKELRSGFVIGPLCMIILFLIIQQFTALRFNQIAIISTLLTTILGIALAAAYLYFKNERIKVILLIVPFFALTINGMIYHKIRLDIERTAGGFWQLQRNWIDMQKFVRENTPPQALILTPNNMEMGGFRIFSERSVVVCYRDCGAIGFDYRAALEWKKRLADVAPFEVLVKRDISQSLINAIGHYKVNYIVFMNYLRVEDSPLLKKVYENETFSLFRVTANPL